MIGRTIAFIGALALGLLHSEQALACCDKAYTDFYSTVAAYNEFQAKEKVSPEDRLIVVYGTVRSLRAIKPLRGLREMDVEVHSVLQGEFKDRILFAKTTLNSNSETFDQYAPGKKYLLAFTWQEDEHGLVLGQRSCGRFYLEMPEQ